ncbi:putative serine protease K12H4.7 [Haliotis cracherodii]|uniref:putative serine protease K12H4.7 n=1 Tax=Haliotis cracherodii TaxID=6455 RepID=UPI0039E9A713
MQKLAFVVVVVLACLHASAAYVPRFLNGRPRGGMVGRPASKRLSTDPLPPDMWMEQTLDHFNDANTQTWQQRYFVNEKYFKPGGPVFLMIGGEGTADPIWMVEGMWVEYAKNFNAMCFQLEHRFYGKSHPTPDISDDSLQYLSSEQALADLAAFIQFAKSKFNLDDNKWISFGGSYPGSLSGWLRMKYPHLITGAVATSAPVLAQLNFVNYLGVVRDSLATTGPDCNKNILEATVEVELRLQTQPGRDELKKLFNLCDDIDVGNANDVANLYQTLAGNFEGVVQYNKDNRAFEGGAGANITVDTLCGLMTDSSITPIERYAKVNNLLMTTYEQKCVDFVYSKMIDGLKMTDWNSSASEGGRQWTYQTCTEFGFFQSSDLDDQPFGHNFPVSFSVQQCMDIFGSKFNADLIQHGINRTNTNYGAYGIKITKVVFPNGSIDPWHALGITEDLGPDATAVFINGTAHCANMYPPTDTDLPELVQARATIQKLIGQWLS